MDIEQYLASIGAKGGKIGGKAKSAAKRAAARANGRKGGRPRKPRSSLKERKSDEPIGRNSIEETGKRRAF